MTTYKITATRLDGNTRIGSSNPETLGDSYGKTYTRLGAEAAMHELEASRIDYGMPDAEYQITESEPREYIGRENMR